MLFDMHTHTKFSADSENEPEAQCLEAIEKGLCGICFTDHVDLNPKDAKYYGFYKPQDFWAEFSRLKEKYAGRLELLAGLEVGEPHLYKEHIKQYSEMPYDFILGSVHLWYNDMSIREMIAEKIPLDVSYALYWDAVLEAAKAGGFDSLGHIDFPKRYYGGELLYEVKKIEAIYREMLKNNICMEINTSSIRRGGVETMPGKDLLAIYKDVGGRFITLGSDAHFTGNLAADFDYAKELIKHFGFQEVVFRQRKPYLVKNEL